MGPGALFTRARDVQTGLPGESEWRGSRLAQQRERDGRTVHRHHTGILRRGQLLIGKGEKERKKTDNPERKKRKKTDNPREGWEDGTPPPHRDFKEGTVWC